MDRTVCIAPMLDYTNKHFRYFLRLISPHVLLFGEMVKPELFYKDSVPDLLTFNNKEQPLVAQLAGNNPQVLASQAQKVEGIGYNEVNLNVGCPGRTVNANGYGVCLFDKPELVAACLSAMRKATNIPVSLKTRIGIYGREDYKSFRALIEKCYIAGCETFYVHARTAILDKNVDSKMNREIPPLDFNYIKSIKKDFPTVTFIANGGICNIEDIKHHLHYCDGVMIGREILRNPFFLLEIDREIFKTSSKDTLKQRSKIIAQYCQYMKSEFNKTTDLRILLTPLVGVFADTLYDQAWCNSLANIADMVLNQAIDQILDFLNYIKDKTELAIMGSARQETCLIG